MKRLNLRASSRSRQAAGEPLADHRPDKTIAAQFGMTLTSLRVDYPADRAVFKTR
jgi:hypothetical protein